MKNECVFKQGVFDLDYILQNTPSGHLYNKQIPNLLRSIKILLLFVFIRPNLKVMLVPFYKT